MDIIGKPGIAFYPEEEGVPPYDELIIVANKAKVTDKRYSQFLDAIERGVQYLINHPDKSWQLFIRAHKNLDDELNRRAWRDTLPRFTLRPSALDSKRYRRFAAFLKKPLPRPLVCRSSSSASSMRSFSSVKENTTCDGRRGPLPLPKPLPSFWPGLLFCQALSL